MMREWWLYVMVAHSAGSSFFKVGISLNPLKRVAQLQTGCPHVITELLLARMPGQHGARQAERAMHWALEAFATTGEWFEFDLSNAAHKRAFHAAAQQSITPVVGEVWGWNRIQLAKLRQHLGELDRDAARDHRERVLAHTYRLAKGKSMW